MAIITLSPAGTKLGKKTLTADTGTPKLREHRDQLLCPNAIFLARESQRKRGMSHFR